MDQSTYVCNGDNEDRSAFMASSGTEEAQQCTTEVVEVRSTTVKSAATEGDADVEPHVGMEFESRKIAFSCYNDYARRMGFGITTRYSTTSKKNGKVNAIEYACTRHGYRRISDKVQNLRGTKKIGCKAKMNVKRRDDDKWVVDKLVLEHNHELDPKAMCFFPSQRKTRPKKRANSQSYNSGVPKGTIVPYVGSRYGGIEIVPRTDRDCRYEIDSERKKFIERGDAQTLFDHFRDRQKLDPTFFYSVQLDETNHLKSVLWVDAKSRVDYTHFGDVVTFETTYLTDGYSIPFVPFVGVNHHGQSVLFGCALITDETVSSFVWVFETWLSAMFGRTPKAIITDQDRAMKAAIMQVLPKSCHRFCLWNTMQKVRNKLGHLCESGSNFKKQWDECVYDCMTIIEFEEKWQIMVKEYDLKENEWINILYEDRHHWAPPYLKDTFFAGMSISQRRESVRPFFYGYFNWKTTLQDFVRKYQSALKKIYDKEAEEDFITFNKVPSLRTANPFEKQLSVIYTSGIFKKFQAEVLGLASCVINDVQHEGPIKIYKVKDLGDKIDYRVMWNGEEMKVSCVCYSFEFRGYLCTHALQILLASSVFTIPSHYILKRWSKGMKNQYGHSLSSSELQGNHINLRAERFNDLIYQSMKIAEEGSLSVERYNYARSVLVEALKKIIADPSETYKHGTMTNGILEKDNE